MAWREAPDGAGWGESRPLVSPAESTGTEKFARIAVLDQRPPYPNLAERVIRAVLQVVTVAALVLACVIMVGLIRFGSAAADTVDRTRQPEPAATGCPFGDGECGG